MTNARRSKQELPRPSAEFGRAVVALLTEVGKTKDDLLRATNYTGSSTVARLARGDGSMAFAHAAKQVLKDWGADVSTLPALYLETDEPVEEWLREWVALGEQLHALASEKRWRVEVDRIHGVINAHRVVAEGTEENPRRRG